jgi:hypothetical protein
MSGPLTLSVGRVDDKLKHVEHLLGASIGAVVFGGLKNMASNPYGQRPVNTEHAEPQRAQSVICPNVRHASACRQGYQHSSRH